MSSMMSALSNWLVNPRRNPLARLHMHAVSSRLRKYGNPGSDLASIPHGSSLRDFVLFLLVPLDLNGGCVLEALGRLPREVVDARIQRLKRAMDLSMKHQYLPEDLQVRVRSFP
ncbi:hypothetical protein HU200_029877 [Digitaria exilis]|uniref:Uncharacterized protein n=1 Tax=Digitaria exilis TaxID=1010633 RepID=A0A835ESE8_9POAL|nr:hypothetical protein HU200_029877 [Digitaria exilis]